MFHRASYFGRPEPHYLQSQKKAYRTDIAGRSSFLAARLNVLLSSQSHTQFRKQPGQNCHSVFFDCTTAMMKFALTTTLLLASVLSVMAAQDPVLLVQAETETFVDEQFSYYFTDCFKFVETFGSNFEYCDFAPGIKTKKTGCITKDEDLLEACLETQGNPTNIYQLDTKPVFTGITSSYNDIAIKGFQKVFGVPVPDAATGAISILDLCFDLVVVESLQASESELGIESTFWKGYFSIEFCGIPGLPPCQCDSLTPIASYNF